MTSLLKFSSILTTRLLRSLILLVLTTSSMLAHAEHSKAQASTRSTSLITNKLDATIEFYGQFGYSVSSRSEISSEAILSSMAIAGSDDSPVEFVVLAAPNKSDENKGFSGINLIGVPHAGDSPFSQDPARLVGSAQLLFSFQVTGLDQMAESFKSNNIIVIKPIALSSTGKSRTMTVYDPNGVRVDIYEYLTNK